MRVELTRSFYSRGKVKSQRCITVCEIRREAQLSLLTGLFKSAPGYIPFGWTTRSLSCAHLVEQSAKSIFIPLQTEKSYLAMLARKSKALCLDFVSHHTDKQHGTSACGTSQVQKKKSTCLPPSPRFVSPHVLPLIRRRNGFPHTHTHTHSREPCRLTFKRSGALPVAESEVVGRGKNKNTHTPIHPTHICYCSDS
jgi:hypothetical protein